jgi:hypothetical protein
MRNLGLILVACSLACAAPEGEMGGTETETETDGSGSSSGGDATMTASSVTNDPSMATTAGNTMATSTSPSTTNGSDPDSSSTAGDPDSSSSGEPQCIPGELGCPCDIGSTCADALFCVDGVCQDTPACDEPEGEPNDDEASAVALEEAVCGGASDDVDGGIDGAESDWFTFHASAPFGCPLDKPGVAVTADAELSVCIFVTCDEGELVLDCAGDAEASDSPDGTPGCCAPGAVALSSFGCGGFMGSGPGTGTVWARVTSVEGACTPYTLEWDY